MTQSNERSSVTLTDAQREYLLQASFLPCDVRGALAAAASDESRGARTRTLDPLVADRIASSLTTQLAKAGFDSNYDPTNEGQTLEEAH